MRLALALHRALAMYCALAMHRGQAMHYWQSMRWAQTRDEQSPGLWDEQQAAARSRTVDLRC